MDEQLRKRLEEAADSYIKETIPADIPGYSSVVETTKQDFKAGGEWMFQECGGMIVLHDMRRLILAQCKEWLKTHTPIIHTEEGDYVHSPGFRMIPLSGFLADFEADMNKLWEEKK